MSHAPVRPGKPDPKDFLALDALLSDEERLIRDTVRGFVSDRILPDIAEWFEAGVFPRELPGRWGSLDFSACTSRGTAAPEPVRSRTAWPARNSNTATREPVRSSASRDRWRCFRSGPSGPKTRSRSGSRRWQPAKPSAALASPRPTPEAIRVRCAPRRGATGRTGSSAARRCGSPTAGSPTSPSSGPRPKTASGVSSSPPTPRASRPTTSITNCRCEHR